VHLNAYIALFECICTLGRVACPEAGNSHNAQGTAQKPLALALVEVCIEHVLIRKPISYTSSFIVFSRNEVSGVARMYVHYLTYTRYKLVHRGKQMPHVPRLHSMQRAVQMHIHNAHMTHHNTHIVHAL